MRLKEALEALLTITITIVVMFLAAALLEIIVSAIAPRFYSLAFTMACWVAGVFSGLFCYGSVLKKISKENKEKAALYSTLTIIAISALLFFVMAWPVKLFSITQALTTFLLWKTKFQ